MNNNEIRKFALALLAADTEDIVIETLKNAGFWDDQDAWRLCGDNDGNFATVGNQQARPEAALVEKIVNSVDARLLNECLTRGIDPESEAAPRSIRHAISVFFDGKAQSSDALGTIAEWTGKKQLEEAQKITLALTGNKPRQGMPCITITDQGEGQTPAQFPDTFLSMHKANKLRIQFVQGKFNMGGTGVLKFCGRNSFQLIISRRNPKIIEAWANRDAKWTSKDKREDEWGVTIVRRERPSGAAGQVRNSVFKYLAPIKSPGGSNEVLSFESSTLRILPEENRPYSRDATYGSVIKLYEYDTKGFSSQALMKGGLLSRMEVFLPQIALPVRVHECREYRGEEARSFANTLVGLAVRLGENRGDNLEDGYPTTTSFVVKQEKMTAQIYAFKGDKAESYRTNEGIIFMINGQNHGAIAKTFFERAKVKMGRLAKSLLILIDCTNMSVGAREDLFMNSRDRLSNGELRKAIEEELESIVRNHPGLRELRERRRTEEISNRLADSKPLEDILSSIIKASPTLTRLFVFGQRLSKPHRAEIDAQAVGGGQGQVEGDGKFESKTHPTYFHFAKKKYGDRLIRSAEIDRRCRIKFETDARNDYFERTKLPGSYEIEVIDGPLEGVDLSHSVTIHNGIANWSIKLPDDQVAVGDRLTIQCSVTDETLIDPFVNVATISLTPHEEQSDSTTKSKRSNNTSGGETGQGGTGSAGNEGTNRVDGKSASGGITLPPITQVERGDESWVRHGFDETTACIVIEDDVNGQSTYSFYINIDNIYLKTEMKEAKADVALEKTKFIWANVLIGLALIHDPKTHPKGEAITGDGEIDTETVLRTNLTAKVLRTTTSGRGIAQIKMTILLHPFARCAAFDQS